MFLIPPIKIDSITYTITILNILWSSFIHVFLSYSKHYCDWSTFCVQNDIPFMELGTWYQIPIEQDQCCHWYGKDIYVHIWAILNIITTWVQFAYIYDIRNYRYLIPNTHRTNPMLVIIIEKYNSSDPKMCVYIYTCIYMYRNNLLT